MVDNRSGRQCRASVLAENKVLWQVNREKGGRVVFMGKVSEQYTESPIDVVVKYELEKL